MITCREVAAGSRGLRLYRIDAEPKGVAAPGLGLDPMALLFERVSTATTRQVVSEFSESGPPVSASSLRVACHVVSTPDALMIVDATFPQTAQMIFPFLIDAICRGEGRAIGGRPIELLYTHAHFDHAGGRSAVEAMRPDVRTFAHPYIAAQFPISSRPDQMFRSDGHFLRDCGIGQGFEELAGEFERMREGLLDRLPPDADLTLMRGEGDAQLAVDVPIDIDASDAQSFPLLAGRAKAMRFDGHMPGHLCVVVDDEHLISGDMWLPATTSTVTPGRRASRAGVPADRCGVRRYVDSSARLLRLPVDRHMSYPSHESIFSNPKRMAMRDLESFASRLERIYAVLAEHQAKAMRVLDLAWGGSSRLPIWKVLGSKYRLFMAHEEATAYVEDLVAVGDLEEVAPERYVWTGNSALKSEILDVLAAARRRFGHLEFQSRGGSTSSAAPSTGE